MLSPQRIRLTLAMLLVMAMLIALGLTLDIGQTAPAKTLQAKLLRRTNDHSKPSAAEKDYLRKHASIQEEKKEEREFENKVPQHLPIKVKIRAEKEKAAKDMSNDRWHRDLEIEVKNIGDKPIYYMFLVLEMPEIQLGGGTVSFTLSYGTSSLISDSKGVAKPEDIPIKPKETLVLRLDDQQARAWEGWKKKWQWSQPKKILIQIDEVSFGDGTGFFGGNGAPWPLPKRSESTPEGRPRLNTKAAEIRKHHATQKATNSLLKSLIGGESAISWSTTFRSGECLDSPTTDGVDDVLGSLDCCPSGCQFVNVYRAKFCYYCPELPHADGVACIYEFDGICATVEYDQRLCNDDEVYCPFQRAYPCGYVPPSPTPTSSPTPTPTPPM